MIIIVIEECQLILHTGTFKRYYVFYSYKLSYVFTIQMLQYIFSRCSSLSYKELGNIHDSNTKFIFQFNIF